MARTLARGNVLTAQLTPLGLKATVLGSGNKYTSATQHTYEVNAQASRLLEALARAQTMASEGLCASMAVL